LLFIKVPYLTRGGELAFGFLVDVVNLLKPGLIGKPANHQFYFTGDRPYYSHGNPIMMLGGGEPSAIALEGQTIAKLHFSMKLLANGVMRDYSSLFEKVETYYDVISGPALEKFPDAHITDVIELSDGRVSPFVFPDTMSAFSELESLNVPFYSLRIAIIGLGGTGSYLLDFLAKMPVAEIVLIDDDVFEVKNSYRSPGSTTVSEFGSFKVDVLKSRYSSFRSNITAHADRLCESNVTFLDNIDFAFLCVDRADSRLECATLLRARHIPFIDVGLGLENSGSGLKGMIRSTLVNEASNDTVVANKSLPSKDIDADDAYRKIVQIAELNALNACLAIIRFKKLYGFYGDERPNCHELYVPHRSAMFVELIGS
jgi:hypothetical protein